MPGLTVNQPMPTIGVDKYTFFEITADGASGITYGAPASLPGTVEIAPTDSGGADNFDADNRAYVIDTYIEKMGHDITNTDIPPAVDAKWRGLETHNGGMLMDAAPRTKYFGVAWRLLKADGKYRYVKYFKGTYSFASSVGGKTRASNGASEKQTAKATFNAAQTEYCTTAAPNGLMYMYIDETDALALKESSGDAAKYANRAAFEAAWFGSMGTLVGDSGDDTNITTAEA